MPSNIESFSNARDSLPNVYTNITAREVDFVTRFNNNWDALRTILGIMRPIRKAPGSKLVSYRSSIALESGNVAPGEVIPYSKATIEKVALDDLSVEKYAKAVPIEDVEKYGAAIAVEKSDDAFLTRLQNSVMSSFYAFLNTGTLTGIATTWQGALAKAMGEALNKFAAMQKEVTEVVGFANVLDAYDYLGAANISIQTQFGISYVKDFMGYGTLFLLPSAQIARNKVIATPVENIDLYYIDPGDSDFAKLGLNYTVQGETNLIGFHAQGNYNTAVGESFALMGMALWAEYLDGISVITVEASGSVGSATFTSAAGTTAGTKITVTAPTMAPDMKVYVKAQASTAPSTPSYKDPVDSTWTEIFPDLTSGIADNVTGFTAGHKMVMAITNGAGQTIYTRTTGVDVVNHA